MICDILHTLVESLKCDGHDGPIKLRLPASAFGALMEEIRPLLRVEVPTELARGARRSVRVGNVEVVE